MTRTQLILIIATVWNGFLLPMDLKKRQLTFAVGMNHKRDAQPFDYWTGIFIRAVVVATPLYLLFAS